MVCVSSVLELHFLTFVALYQGSGTMYKIVAFCLPVVLLFTSFFCGYFALTVVNVLRKRYTLKLKRAITLVTTFLALEVAVFVVWNNTLWVSEDQGVFVQSSYVVTFVVGMCVVVFVIWCGAYLHVLKRKRKGEM